MRSVSRWLRVFSWLLIVVMLFNLLAPLAPVLAQEASEPTAPSTESMEPLLPPATEAPTDTLPLDAPVPDVAPVLLLPEAPPVEQTAPPSFPASEPTDQQPGKPPVRSFPTADALGVALESPQQEAEPGQMLTYHLVIGNQRGTTLSDIQVHDTLPEGLLFLPGNPAHLRYEPGSRTFAWEIASLQLGEVLTATFAARVTGTAHEVLVQQVQATTPGQEPSTAWSAMPVGRLAQGEVWITPHGGTLEVPAHALHVYLPAQAVSTPVRVRVDAPAVHAPALEREVTRFVLRLNELGGGERATLDQPLQLAADLRSYRDQLQGVPTFYRLNDQSGQWELVPSRLNWDRLTLSAETREVGTFAVASSSGLQLSYGVQQLPTIHGFTSDEFSGNSSIQYPLVTPPGPGGLGISLGLAYSSESATSILAGRQDTLDGGLDGFFRQAGPAGWGWSLTGLGQITYNRISQEYALSYGGGSFNLLSPAQSGSGWQTSPQSFLHIDYNNNAAAPAWTVYASDGTRYIFGDPNPADGIQEGVAFTPVIGYAGGYPQCQTTELREAHLTRIIDPLGNQVRVSYLYERRAVDGVGCTYEHVVLPEHIEYVPSGSASPSAQILFGYAGRADINLDPWDKTNLVYYFSYRRLETITMQVRTTAGTFQTARSYLLTHDYDAFAGDAAKSIMRLRAITEYGKDGSALPAWQFSYARQSSKNPVVSDGVASARANLTVLTQANNGQGGTVTYNYELVTGIPYVVPVGHVCYGRATARLRVSQMVISDGLGGSTTTSYSSQNPRAWSDGWDDCEGDFEFGGHQTVLRTLKEGATVVQQVESRFHQETETEWVATSWRAGDLVNPTSEFAPVKGKVWQQRTLSPTGAELQRINTTWRMQESAQTKNSPWVYKSDDTTTLENTAPQRTSYEYRPTHQGNAQYGNLTHAWQYKDGGSSLYRLTERWFFPNPTTHITGHLARQKLWDYQTGSPVCRGDSVQLYDTQPWSTPPTRGLLSLQQVAQSSCDGTWSETSYWYDTWGNPITTRDPRGYYTTTEYDTVLRAYPVSVTTPPVAAGQFTTRYEWDFVLGQVTAVVDPAGQRTEYRYDGLGRLARLWKPGHNNSDTFPTQSFEYANYTSAASPMRVLQRQRLDVSGTTAATVFYQESYTFYDGLGQAVQTRTSHMNAASQLAHRVTLTRYSALGKPVQVYAPVEDTVSTTYRPASWFSGKPASTTQYDALGRPTIELAPDGLTRTEHRYGLVSDGGWLQYHDVVDANRHRTQYRTDLLGRMVQVVEISGDCGTYWGYTCTAAPYTTPWAVYATTRYSYDVADRLVGVTDAQNNLITIGYDLQGRKTTMSDPDMGTWRYDYDPAGNLTRQTDARSCQIAFGYDALGRLTSKSYTPLGSCAATPSVTYRYDSYPTAPTGYRAFVPGQRTAMYDGTGSTTWNYDVRNRPVREVKLIKDATGTSHTFTTAWSYDSADRARSLSYPANGVTNGAETVTYNYDSRQLLLNNVSGATLYATNMAYNSYGQLTSLQYGTSPTPRTQTYQYYPLNSAGLGRLQATEVVGIKKWSYGYDAVGNVTTITDHSDNQVQRFGYDHRDRLIWAEATGGTQGPFARETYAYDLLGNLYGQGGTSYGYTSSGCSTTSSRPHAVHQATAGTTSTRYCYDQSGNLTQRVTGVSSGGGGGTETMGSEPAPQTSASASASDLAPSVVLNPTVTRNLNYDVENRLVAMSETGGTMPAMSMAYDGAGKRVRLTEGSTTTLYVGNHFEYKLSGTTATPIRYYYAGAQRIALRVGNATAEWLVGDHLGSTSVTLATNGSLKAELRYKPWGQTRYESGTTPTQHRYTGQIQDASSGLYFYNARYYDPALGKFIQADTIVPEAGNPQAFNRYSYVKNNPVKYNDPSGHIGINPANPGTFCPDNMIDKCASGGEVVGGVVIALIVQYAPAAINAAQAWGDKVIAVGDNILRAATNSGNGNPANNAAGRGGNTAPSDPNNFDPDENANLINKIRAITDKFKPKQYTDVHGNPTNAGQVSNCGKCAGQIYNILKSAGYNAEHVRYTGGNVWYTKSGILVTNSGVHELVRVGSRVFDALTGPQGMLWDDYIQLYADPSMFQVLTETVLKP